MWMQSENLRYTISTQLPTKKPSREVLRNSATRPNSAQKKRGSSWVPNTTPQKSSPSKQRVG